MIDGEGGAGWLVVGERAERDELAGFRGDVNGFESFRALLRGRHHFHHHVVFIQTFINVGNLALAEGIAKGVVDVLDGNA